MPLKQLLQFILQYLISNKLSYILHVQKLLKIEFLKLNFFLDFDGDDMLGINDIKQVIQYLIGEHSSFNDNDLKYLVQKIFEEVDFDDDGALSFSEFEHVTDMCPDFVKLVKMLYNSNLQCDI